MLHSPLFCLTLHQNMTNIIHQNNPDIMSSRRTGIQHSIEVFVHVITWAYIFLSPLFFKRSNESIDWGRYLNGCTFPLYSCVVFYANYFILIPRYVLQRHHLRMFVGVNVLMCLLFLTLLELQPLLLPFGCFVPRRIPSPEERAQFPPKIFFIIRGFLTFAFVICVSVALRLSLKWHQSEHARAEAELRRSEAELKNLKNQINPHFLLNTLNNIYALTAFDTEKAQQAIHELSRLLRYMLYENQSDRVPLSHEVDFIKSYVSLMKIRLNDNVEVILDTDDIADADVQVSPLLFISLVENAFKHGVSPTEDSFIHISLKADRSTLVFECVNSNYPKSHTDKAPGGIGLVQVRKRLELAYAQHYTWDYGVTPDGKDYRSVIHLDFCE